MCDINCRAVLEFTLFYRTVDLMDRLREIPSRESLALRAEARPMNLFFCVSRMLSSHVTLLNYSVFHFVTNTLLGCLFSFNFEAAEICGGQADHEDLRVGGSCLNLIGKFWTFWLLHSHLSGPILLLVRQIAVRIMQILLLVQQLFFCLVN